MDVTAVGDSSLLFIYFLKAIGRCNIVMLNFKVSTKLAHIAVSEDYLTANGVLVYFTPNLITYSEPYNSQTVITEKKTKSTDLLASFD